MTKHSSNLCEPSVSVGEVAAHFRLTRDLDSRRIETKCLPARKVGRLWKFKLSDVDERARTSGDDDAPGAKREK